MQNINIKKFKKNIIESLRIFGLLLHKCWLVRKRQWITSLIAEILIPMSLIFLLWNFFATVTNDGLIIRNETHYESRSSDELIDLIENWSGEILYTPSNPFTDELMMKVDKCLKNKLNVSGFDTESKLIAYFTAQVYWNNIMAVIFDKSVNQTTKHLHYKFQGWSVDLETLHATAFDNFTASYTEYTYFVQTQICLDRSYIQMKSNKSTADIPEISIQQIPYPSYTTPFLPIIVAQLFLPCIFMIPVFFETSKTTKEKFVGINVLMSMNGIPITLNLLSWLVSGLVFLSPLCIMTLVSLIIGMNSFSHAVLIHGNALIVFLIFIFHFIHSIAFAIHLSAYFTKSFYLMLVLFVLNLVVLFIYLVISQLYRNTLPYMVAIFPVISLYQIVDEISTYEWIGIGVQWTNLFENSNAKNKFEDTIGMMLVLSLIGTLLHFCLAIYVNIIKPGKYGIGKHPLFLLMVDRKEKVKISLENIVFDDKNNKYFEPYSARACTPGIQIRHLTKAYNISIFKKQKVHALQGISIDFYKGQITAILGHNGAGKSTLMSILTGTIRPTDGLILIDSKNLKDSASEILKDVGFYAQTDMYFTTLTVAEQLKFFAMIKKGDKSKSSIESNVDALIEKLKLVKVKNVLPNKLSEDQKRKLCLGMAFVGDPSTLILDEPTSLLDRENKRLIWDILLEMKNQKTILLSTHDMEEADILGDRIAIMHEGRIKSYGTPLFLKKMLAGQNNIEITLSVERWSDPDRIRNQLHSETNIVEKRDKTIIVSVPITSSLPESLKKMEENKKDLGITDYALSPVGLEQVFLKVAEISEMSPKTECRVHSSYKMKLNGVAVCVQRYRALFAKKWNYFLVDSATLLTQILAVLLTLIGNLVVYESSMMEWTVRPKTVHVHLDLYNNPHILYKSTDENFGIQYKNICESLGGTNVQVVNNSLDDELMRLAKQDLLLYRNYLIAAAEFNQSVVGNSIATALYSGSVSLSLPISINLLSNTIIQNLSGSDYSISISGQKFLGVYVGSNDKESMETDGYIAAVLFALPIYFAIAMFAAHPVRESASGLKHLQMMTGISGFTYWAAMFLSDLAHFMFLVIILVLGLKCADHFLDLHFYGTTEMIIMILLLMLLAINVLPLIYSFSFMKTKISRALKFFTLIPIGIVITDIIVFHWEQNYNPNGVHYLHLRIIHLLLPYVSFLRGQMKLYKSGILNAVCRKFPDDFYVNQCRYSNGFCCEQDCKDRSCQKLIPYFHDDDIDSLKVSVIFLCAMPILYFGILTLLECHIVQRITNKFAKKVMESQCMQKLMRLFSKENVRKISIDEQVQLEKLTIFRKIQEINENQYNRHIKNSEITVNEELFLAYELRKFYRKVKAIKDVSFRIIKSECFGFFGANRSGKSTILEMMTGKEVPDSGLMYAGSEEFNNNEKFLSQLGYCCQNDAALKLLNTYDHLRLFARLRGVAEDQVEDEVQTWITRLCLNTYASQPSSTLSSGNNQRLNIAMALVGNPDLILLDEPTTRMDPGARRSFYKTVKSCQSAGQTFLLTSHNIDECEALCKRTVVMENGKLLFIGSPEELKQRFGAGYDVQIRMNSAKVKNQLKKIKKDMRLLLHCVLANETSEYLMYHVIGVCTTWSKIYEVMNKIKKKYDCIDDFVVVVRLSA